MMLSLKLRLLRRRANTWLDRKVNPRRPPTDWLKCRTPLFRMMFERATQDPIFWDDIDATMKVVLIDSDGWLGPADLHDHGHTIRLIRPPYDWEQDWEYA